MPHNLFVGLLDTNTASSPVEQRERIRPKASLMNLGFPLAGGQRAFAGQVFDPQAEPAVVDEPSIEDFGVTLPGGQKAFMGQVFDQLETVREAERSSEVTGSSGRALNAFADAKRSANQPIESYGLVQQLLAERDGLSPEGQAALDRLLQVVDEQISDIDRRIASNLTGINLLESLQADVSNEDIAAEELLQAADAENLQPGLTEDFFKRLSEADDRSEAMLLLSTEEAKQRAILNVENFVASKQQLTRFKGELPRLLAEEAATRLQPQLPFSFIEGVQGDPVEFVSEMSFMEAADDLIPPDLAPQIQEGILQQLQLIATSARDVPFTNIEGFMNSIGDQIVQLAKSTGKDEFTVKTILETAIGRQLGFVESVQQAVKTGKAQAGSRALITVVYETILDKTGDPNLASKYANSKLFHLLLSLGGENGVVSAGKQLGGDLIGTSMLSAEVYEAMGLNPDDVQGDLLAQIEGLFEYIENGFRGEIENAFTQATTSGEWGTLHLLRKNTQNIDQIIGSLQAGG